MKPVGPNDKSVPNLDAATTPIADSDLALVYQGNVLKKTARSNLVRSIPIQMTMFHGGPTTNYTAPTAATTNGELATVPMARLLQDMQNATQARLVVGQRALGVGYTTAVLRAQVATNGLTQSTWVELAATASGGDVSLMGGTASIIRASAWFNIAAGAKIADAVLRVVFNSTGTGTTAATVSFVDLLVR